MTFCRIHLLVPLEDESSNHYLNLLLSDFAGGRGVVPLVGAGLSIPFGVRGWRDVLLHMAKEIDQEDAIRQKLGNPNLEDYEGAAEQLLNEMGRPMFENLFQRDFLVRLKRDQRYVCTVELLPHLPPGPIITTNFDRVLESVFEFAGEPFQPPILGGRPGAFVAALQNRTDHF